MASSRIIHRKTRKLPSVRKHGFSAILFLCLILLSSYAWLQFAGKKVNQPSANGPEFKLANPTEANVNGAVEALPDLLDQDNIPQDVNPTETMDLLGGPKTSTGNGPRPPSQNTSASPNGPKTILIDGAPITSSSVQINPSPPLTKAPIQGLTRMSPFGLVPAPAQNGRTALGSYAKPFTPIAGQKYVSLIVGGLGLNPVLTQRAINELPGEVSLSFAAQTPNLQNWIDRARLKGHEVLIELPMQSSATAGDTDDEYMLTTKGPHSVNIRNLDYLFSRAQGYFAVTNYGGESLLKDASALRPILDHVRNSGLGFVYDNSISTSVLNSTATKSSVPFVVAHTMIDNTSHRKAIVIKQLGKLPTSQEKIAIGMGFSYEGTIDGILGWVISNKTVKLAPASYALKSE